jgi:hypothetical protein
MIFNKPNIFITIFAVATTITYVSAGSLYEITFKDYEPLVNGENKYINVDKVKLKRFNRTHPHVFIGEVEVFIDLGNDIEVIEELHKQQGYEYRPTPYRIKDQLCDLIAFEKVFYPTVLPYTDFPKPGTVIQLKICFKSIIYF